MILDVSIGVTEQNVNKTKGISMILDVSIGVTEHFCSTSNEILTFSISIAFKSIKTSKEFQYLVYSYWEGLLLG